MIIGKNIHKCFNKLDVLKGVDIKINKSEIVSIVGSSGAGKTTLLQILGLLDSPTNEDAKLLINDINVLQLNEYELSNFRNKNIGFIFQFHQLLPEFTALENICIPGLINNSNLNDLTVRAKELMNYLDLENRYYHKPNELSGGEQQRVAVARSLINNPKIILADEPSGNLDCKSAENLHKLFFKLRKEFSHTFIIVTHNEKLASMCDKKIEINDGNLIL